MNLGKIFFPLKGALNPKFSKAKRQKKRPLENKGGAQPNKKNKNCAPLISLN